MAARKAPAAKPATNDRNKALEVALSQIDKQFGKGSVMRLGDDNRPPVQVIPTGSLALDVALGIGGLAPSPKLTARAVSGVTVGRFRE